MISIREVRRARASRPDESSTERLGRVWSDAEQQRAGLERGRRVIGREVIFKRVLGFDRRSVAETMRYKEEESARRVPIDEVYFGLTCADGPFPSARSGQAHY